MVYDPPGGGGATVTAQRKRPPPADIVEFVARTVAPLRSSMFKTTPPMPLEPESRTYPVTPSELPETTDWPLEGVRIAVNPAGGGWTVKVMLAKLLASCAAPPSLTVLSGSTMSSSVCAPSAPIPATFNVWFRDVATVRPFTRATSLARFPAREAPPETAVAVVCPWC